MTNQDYAYLAGLMDGEGSILLSKNSKIAKWRWPQISIASTTYELLDWCKTNFKGTICSHKTYKTHHKPHWSWRLQGNVAIEVLKLIVPFMKEPSKVIRAKMLIDEYHLITVRNGRYSQDQKLAKQEFESRFLSS
jgi:hypothetical protein